MNRYFRRQRSSMDLGSAIQVEDSIETLVDSASPEQTLASSPTPIEAQAAALATPKSSPPAKGAQAKKAATPKARAKENQATRRTVAKANAKTTPFQKELAAAPSCGELTLDSYMETCEVEEPPSMAAGAVRESVVGMVRARKAVRARLRRPGKRVPHKQHSQDAAPEGKGWCPSCDTFQPLDTMIKMPNGRIIRRANCNALQGRLRSLVAPGGERFEDWRNLSNDDRKKMARKTRTPKGLHCALGCSWRSQFKQEVRRASLQATRANTNLCPTTGR